MAKKRTVYRDRKTGKFVKKKTWERGGDRYKRERIPIGKKREIEPPQGPGVWEWIVAFTYARTGKSFDVIITARDETEAYNTATTFLQEDKTAQRIVRSGLKGWQSSVIRGKLSNEEKGQAEYRHSSKR